MSRPQRLTVRARLTLLNTGLFALCGAIVVAVSYILVAQLGVAGHRDSPSTAELTRFVARCRTLPPSLRSNPSLNAKCSTALQQLGAQHQRALTLSRLLEYSLITLAVVILLAAVLGWVFAKRALRPVHQITAAARTASKDNLGARVALRGPRDELTELADTFDQMLERLQAAFESQSRFIANASHELRTPLAVMRATVDVVDSNADSSPADIHSMAADIREAVDHAEQLIGALLILARNERGLTVHEQIDLATIVEDVLDALDFRDRLLHRVLKPAVVSGDPVLIERLITNLLDNAISYNTPGGEIWVTTDTIDSRCQLTVANTGPVVDPADAARILQPFQRLNDRTSHDGFGLGLAIVASIATTHDGTITVQPRASGGLGINVAFPATS